MYRQRERERALAWCNVKNIKNTVWYNICDMICLCFWYHVISLQNSHATEGIRWFGWWWLWGRGLWSSGRWVTLQWSLTDLIRLQGRNTIDILMVSSCHIEDMPKMDIHGWWHLLQPFLFEYETDRSPHKGLENMDHTGGLEMLGVWLQSHWGPEWLKHSRFRNSRKRLFLHVFAGVFLGQSSFPGGLLYREFGQPRWPLKLLGKRSIIYGSQLDWTFIRTVGQK